MTKDEARAFGRSAAPSDPALREAASERLCAILRAQPLLATAPQVALYAPLAWEPNLLPLLSFLGNRAFFPVTERATTTLRFFHLSDPAQLRKRGWLREPDPATARLAAPWTSADLLLIPALAYDRRGHRVGSGKGYYDRFLAQCPAHKWGVVFAEQLLPAPLPADRWDQPVEALVTDLSFIANIPHPG